MDFGSVDGIAVVGVEQAARAYFGKSAHSLNLYEAAILVGMLKGPSRYNPLKHPAETHVRAAYVLKRMLDEGYITRAQMQAALAGKSRRGKLADGSSGIGVLHVLGHGVFS